MAFSRDLPTSFEDALKTARRILSSRGDLVSRGLVDTEAELIVIAALRASVGGKSISRIELFSRARDRMPDMAGQKVVTFSMARAEGRLLQHITGVQYFMSHEYEVGPDVLVPRPETEALVERAIAELGTEKNPPSLGLEIGIGSGVLSIELLARFA